MDSNKDKAARILHDHEFERVHTVEMAQVFATLAVAEELAAIKRVLQSINNALPNPLDTPLD